MIKLLRAMKTTAALVALVVAAQAQSTPQIRTANGSVLINVPSGGDIHFTEAGEGSVPGVSTSLRGIVDSAAELTNELSENRVELERALSAGVAAAADGRQALADAIQSARSEATDAIDSNAATCLTNIATSSRSLNSSLNSLTAFEAEHYRELQVLQASLRPAKPPNFDLVPGPYGVDIRTRRISTAIYPLNLTIQVSLRANYTAGNPQWVNQTFVLGDSYNSSPSFSETLAFDAANLTVLTPYVTRCRATSRVGSGPWSDVQAFNTTGSIVAHPFSCTAANARGTPRHQMCSVAITVPRESVVYAWFQGHYHGSSWTYGMIDIDADNQGPAQINAPAHGYSTTWEAFHSARVMPIAAGRHVIRTTLFCQGSNNCALNGFGMQGFWMEKTPLVQTARCNYAAWAWPFGGGAMCTLNYQTTEPSIVAASFNGHGRDTHVYVAVQYDGVSPSASSANMLAHTYSTSWENLGSHRTKYVTPGPHRTQAVNWGCRLCASLNGAGLSHLVFPAEVGSTQQFGCTRSWGMGLVTTPRMACRSTITLPFDSYIMAEVSGHYMASGPYCQIALSFDGDVNLAALGSSNSWGTKMVHYGESHQWENVMFKRGTVLAAGQHRVEVWGKCQGSGGFNGMGMDGMWLRSAVPAQ